jgi:hypothetical protein
MGSVAAPPSPIGRHALHAIVDDVATEPIDGRPKSAASAGPPATAAPSPTGPGIRSDERQRLPLPVAGVQATQPVRIRPSGRVDQPASADLRRRSRPSSPPSLTRASVVALALGIAAGRAGGAIGEPMAPLDFPSSPVRSDCMGTWPGLDGRRQHIPVDESGDPRAVVPEHVGHVFEGHARRRHERRRRVPHLVPRPPADPGALPRLTEVPSQIQARLRATPPAPCSASAHSVEARSDVRRLRWNPGPAQRRESAPQRLR